MADLTTEEANLLRPHLQKFVELIDGKRQPKTDAQQRFLECARGLRIPLTNYEIAFVKWLLKQKDSSAPVAIEPSRPSRAKKVKRPAAKPKRALSVAESKKSCRGRWSAEEIEAYHHKSDFYRRKVVFFQGGGVNPR